MKTPLMLLFLFLGSITVFAQDETLLTGNLSGVEQSGIFVKSDSMEASLPVNHLLYAKEGRHLNRYQAFQAALFSQLSNRTDLLSITEIENTGERDEQPPSRKLSTGQAIVVSSVLAIPLGLGASIGVYGVGNIGNESGSFQVTLGSGIFGGVIGAGGAIAFFDSENPSLLPMICFLVPPIGATIGFNMTRRYESSQAGKPGLSVGRVIGEILAGVIGEFLVLGGVVSSINRDALINFKEGHMRLDIPTLSFRPEPYVDLMKVRF